MPLLNILYSIIIYPIEIILEFTFVFLQKVFKETILSLIGISAAISILTLPLYNVAEKWQTIERETQKKLKPGIKKIKTVFSGDEQYFLISAFYRQHKYHPAYSLRTSFGLLVQIPFFIAAYSFLSNLDALKGSSFFLIHNLILPDSLLHLGSFSINILPFLMTFINLVSASLYTKGFETREKLQVFLIPLVFLVLLYNSPSALVVYWTMNNIFSLIKNIYKKIPLKRKTFIPLSLISFLCIFIIYYILFIHNGSEEQRKVIAAIALLIGSLPWILLILSKYSIKIIDRLNDSSYFFIFSIMAICFLIALYLPSTLIVSSPDEFSNIDSYSNPLFFLTNTFFQGFGLFIFWPLCLYLLFPKDIKKVFCFLVFIILSGALINIFIFPGSYGLISSTLQFQGNVSHTRMETLVNLVLLFGLSLVLLFIFVKVKNLFKVLTPISIITLFSLLILSMINISGINNSYLSFKNLVRDEKHEIEIRPLFSLSKTGKNTIIIMLDRASSSFFPYILEESPSLYEDFDGFVYYPNTVSFNGHTKIGAPPLFGGYEYTPLEMNKRNTEPLVNKHNESLLMLPTIFSSMGYKVTVTDPPFPNYRLKDDLSIYEGLLNVNAIITDSVYTDLWIKENNINLPTLSDILKRDILWYSFFRSIPLAFRWTIYQRGDWCSSVSGQKVLGNLNGYSVLDFLPRFTEISEDIINTALLMVNNTTHEGAFLQAPDYTPTLNVTNYGSSPYGKETEYHINIAAYKRLADWFKFLRSNGVYDNSRIIIVSDHGPPINYVSKPTGNMPINFDNIHPILLVKDFFSNGELIIDNTFMSNADTPFLALRGELDTLINPFTGNIIDTQIKEKPLYIGVSDTVPSFNLKDTQYSLIPNLDFYVHTNIFDPNNWEKAGK